MKKRLTMLLRTCIVIVLLLPAMSVNSQCPPTEVTSYRGCPACGKALSVRAQRDNTLKNRDENPKEVQALTISDIRDPKLNGRFFPDMAVEITGYVARVGSGGVKETANCRRLDLRNIRILLVASPKETNNPTKYVVLEITPRWEKIFGWDDSNFKLMLEDAKKRFEGKWVTFRGWMFYNVGLVDEAQSTNPGIGAVWQATPWEVHPVTNYKVLAGPPETATRSQNDFALPPAGRRMRVGASAEPLLYSERTPLDREKVRIESNHATALITSECLNSCEDEHTDKVASCSALPVRKARRVCRLKADVARYKCSVGCVEQ